MGITLVDLQDGPGLQIWASDPGTPGSHIKFPVFPAWKLGSDMSKVLAAAKVRVMVRSQWGSLPVNFNSTFGRDILRIAFKFCVFG
jgi:hypothetical protein